MQAGTRHDARLPDAAVAAAAFAVVLRGFGVPHALPGSLAFGCVPGPLLASTRILACP